MALKDMFKTMKSEGYVKRPLDMYLFQQANKENDRAVNVNAPSQAGKCNRANYYMRMKVQNDGTIDPRTQRIFDNGSGVHTRLQEYLLDMNLLIMDEVPLINEKYNIQGHTDGFLELSDTEVGILEIKSINDNQFNQLKDAKEEHKKQGLIYCYCAEERRVYLRNTYKTLEDFYNSKEERIEYFRSRYQHMKDGSKYTREEKIENEVKLNLIADDILFRSEEPVSKVVFIYENKNNQEIKEYVVERNISTENTLQETLKDYDYLNECCKTKTIPMREGTSKSCQTCRWCDFQSTCWIV